MIAAVNFHYIRDSFESKHPGIYGLTSHEFENQLRELSTVAKFVSAEDLKNHIKKGNPLPDRGILITFDDGLQEQYTKALPILNKLNIPAIFFVNTKPISEQKILNVHKIHILRTQIAPEEFWAMIEEKISLYGVSYEADEIAYKARLTYRYDTPWQNQIKYLLNFGLDFRLKEEIIDDIFFEIIGSKKAEMCEELYLTKEQMKDLAERGFLGCHSHSHYPIGLLSDEEKKTEIGHSKKMLESITKKEIFTFSFPYGSREACNGGAKILKENHFVFSFTMERAFNKNFENPFYISRFDTNDVPGGKFYEYPSSEFFDRYSVANWRLK